MYSELLIERIYQAASEPEMWPSVLYDVSRTVNGDGAGLVTRRHNGWAGWTFSPDVPPEPLSDYLRSEAATRSLLPVKLISANHAGFLSAADYFTKEEYEADPVISCYGAKAGYYHNAASAISIPNADLLIVQLMRRQGKRPFSPEDLKQLDVFRPHLARAGMLAARWHMERLRTIAEALALLELPGAVLDMTGSVLAANQLLEDLTPYVVWLPTDQIGLEDQAAQALFRKAIRDLAFPSNTSVRSFPIRPKTQGEPAIAHLIPTTGRARDFFGGGYGILVITKLTAPAPLNVSLVQGLFDLTSAEAKLASHLAAGLSLDDIAARGAVSYETVRSQLKGVFAKTGTRRQAEVVALLAGVPRSKEI